MTDQGSISNTASNRLLDIREVQRLNSLSRASIYRGVAAGTFPKPIQLTPAGRRVAWREADVQAWLRDPLGWHSTSD
ncbi:AlpA family phage regulatory protein [Erythrobacter sp. A6_0]|uniref:helix-turn-helix transcriptional regulator n=1 Tax=Erythrobacter sp. A6_0 TaxID=2821089 RepID=UPI001ADB02E6|nr:AlpA family phage regulatory protein [Erythrobacter sp. A6_0]MBO9511686.1 AlpA family phage regulatory protein [Erythrobacter sp. A6_0]